MKKILLVFLFLINGLLVAQKPCGLNKGLQEGECKHFYENGQVSEIVNWKKGKAYGNAVFYYKNGKKEAEGTYKKGFKVGTWTYYFENGSVSGKDNWVYRNYMGVLEGDYVNFHYNGKISSSGNFDNGVCKDFKIYREDGSLFKEGEIDSNFLKVGKWIEYYEDGKIKMAEGNMVEGKKEGEWVFYHKDGTIDKKQIYKEGNPFLQRGR